MNAVHPAPLPAASERIMEVIGALCRTLTMRVRARALTNAQLSYIVLRLLAIGTRFRRLAERIRVGNPPRDRARRPRAKPAPLDAALAAGFAPPPGWRRWAAALDKPAPVWRALGHKFAWLLPFAPSQPEFRESAVFHRAQLLALLAEPETRALLLASRYVGDSLRPLCWMLGIDVSALYPARPAAVAFTDGQSAPAPSAANPVPSGNEIPGVAAPVTGTAGLIDPPKAPTRAPDAVHFFATG